MGERIGDLGLRHESFGCLEGFGFLEYKEISTKSKRR